MEQANEPILVYDSSGPYTDSTFEADIRQGLIPLRSSWVEERRDTEAYEGRRIRPEDNGFASQKRLMRRERRNSPA